MMDGMDRREQLAGLAAELEGVERRLARQAAPVRERLHRMGPAGLFAIAADEAAKAEAAEDEDERHIHALAARAAQTLAERMVAGKLAR